MITPEVIRRAQEAGIIAKKSLGQNFLISAGAYDKIIDIVNVRPSDTIVEVGPGLGTLTDRLAGTVKKLIAVEKDDRLSTYLSKRYQDHRNVKIINDDILKFNPISYELRERGYKIVGNIPYYLTSHLIRRLLESWPTPQSIVLTVQKEVAHRIAATSPKMSLLAVAVQFYSKASIEGQISRGSFYPIPKVDSSIIKLTPLAQKMDKNFAKYFFQIVHAGFASKRKQLGGNLSNYLKVPRDKIEQKILLLGISPQRRAETLTIEEWEKITNSFF